MHKIDQDSYYQYSTNRYMYERQKTLDFQAYMYDQ